MKKEFLKPTKEKVIMGLLMGSLFAFCFSVILCTMDTPCPPIEHTILKTYGLYLMYFIFFLYIPALLFTSSISTIVYYIMPDYHISGYYLAFLFLFAPVHSYILSCIIISLLKKIIEKLKLSGHMLNILKNISFGAAVIFTIVIIISFYDIYSYDTTRTDCCSKCIEEYEKETKVCIDRDMLSQECKEFFDTYNMTIYECSRILNT